MSELLRLLVSLAAILLVLTLSSSHAVGTAASEAGFDIQSSPQYYYYRHQKIPLRQVETLLAVRFVPGLDETTKSRSLQRLNHSGLGSARRTDLPAPAMTLLELQGESMVELSRMMSQLAVNDGVSFVSPAFQFDAHTTIIPTDEAIAKFAEGTPLDKILSVTQGCGLSITEPVEWIPNGYLLRSASGNALTPAKSA